jgi:hypothetical protein
MGWIREKNQRPKILCYCLFKVFLARDCQLLVFVDKGPGERALTRGGVRESGEVEGWGLK